MKLLSQLVALLPRRSKNSSDQNEVAKEISLLRYQIEDLSRSVHRENEEVKSSFSQQLQSLDNKLERAWLQIEWLRTRTACYIGDEVALTYLADDTAIFINSNDFGLPANILNGGRHEESNLAVLLSFVFENSVFLDIGANIGFFSLHLAKRLRRSGGRVHAFEPHPNAVSLLKRSVYHNGLNDIIEIHPFGLSDCNGPSNFRYPPGHLGGGGIDICADQSDSATLSWDVKTLDDFMPSTFSCDLVKIDVERHEPHVLRGMRKIISRSTNIKILFEKLEVDAGYEEQIKDFFDDLGLSIFGVDATSSLIELGNLEGVKTWAGYLLATRRSSLESGLNRSGFNIYPAQMTPNNTQSSPSRKEQVVVEASDGGVLWYGPYWPLSIGIWGFKLHGELDGRISLNITERAGWVVARFNLRSGSMQGSFVSRHQLVDFECVLRAADGENAKLALERIEFWRIG